MHESTLFQNGKNVAPDGMTCSRKKRHAVLAIGVGNTGIAALSKLKHNVHQMFISDSLYDHIRFLAIGADETCMVSEHESISIDKASEFFSLSDTDSTTPLLKTDDIKADPTLSWMDIDGISDRKLSQCRQAARFLLIRHADSLKKKLKALCIDILTGLSADLFHPTLDIYLFIDVCTYPGSGCFLDLCYILRQLLEENGWDTLCHMMGLVFLPDVNGQTDTSCGASHYADGYAALKELDYLMDLYRSNDYFSQNYGSFSVHTQQAPLDSCCLISSHRSDNTIFPGAPVDPIQAACDYVSSLLMNTKNSSSEGLELHSYLSALSANRGSIFHFHGANYVYHVIGSAKAVFPYSDVLSYLSAKFQQRFAVMCNPAAVLLTEKTAKAWQTSVGITAEQLYSRLSKGHASLVLPTVEHCALLDCGPFSDDNAPHPWAVAGDLWMAQCKERRARILTALTAPLSTQNLDQVPADALLKQIFLSLHSKCADPKYGPYYAAALLTDPQYGLLSALSKTISVVERKQGGEVKSADVGQRSSAFIRSPGKNSYLAYQESVKNLYLSRNRHAEYADLLTVLQSLQEGVSQLYECYLLPILRLLENWQEVCEANLRFLEEEPPLSLPYVQHLVRVKDLRPELDKMVESLPTDAFDGLLRYLLGAWDSHQINDHTQSDLFIDRYMQSVFEPRIWGSLEAVLSMRNFMAGSSQQQLSERTVWDIADTLCRFSKPLFWYNPASFSLFGFTETYPQHHIFIPEGSDVLSDAFDSFHRSNFDYQIDYSDDPWSISVHQIFFSIPLYAYQGLAEYKALYDKADRTGLHLYARTGRGTDHSGDVDWRSFLPEPVPYSCNPEFYPDGKDILALYTRAEESGLFSALENGGYQFHITAPLPLPAYRVYDFIEDGVFQKQALEQCHDALCQAEQKLLTCPTIERTYRLSLNAGGPCRTEARIDRIRKDLFLSSPRIQQAVQAELEKRDLLRQSIDSLNAIKEDCAQYEDDLIMFADLLLYGILSCTDATGKPLYYAGSGISVCPTICGISYAYITQNGTNRRYVLSQKGRLDMKYADRYPIYQAFLTYRALSLESQPRNGMEEALRTRKIALVRKGDNVIGCMLGRQWDETSLAALRQELSDSTLEERCDLLRFHSGLVACIQDFRAKFRPEDWTDFSSVSPKFCQPKTWLLHDGTRYLYLYEGLDPRQGWDPEAGEWVPIAAGMYLWEPIQCCWHVLTDDKGYLSFSPFA